MNEVQNHTITEAEPVASASPLGVSLATLRGSLDMLEDACNDIEHTLAPVLSAGHPDVFMFDPVPDIPGSSDRVREIAECNARVVSVVARVRGLVMWLES